jgi:hypothetical protein
MEHYIDETNPNVIELQSINSLLKESNTIIQNEPSENIFQQTFSYCESKIPLIFAILIALVVFVFLCIVLYNEIIYKIKN